MAVKSHYSLD